MAGKMVLGIILLLVGLWLLIPGITLSGYMSGAWLSEFIALIKGIIPPILIFLGFILVWIESEELKVAKPSRRK